jgi:ATPase subunit of ABC transporter with duplicated ATPase domains
MLSKMMMEKANVIMLDEPTNHLDLESITTLNNSLINFKGNVLFTTQDHAFAQSIGNRILEITPNGAIDRQMKFDEYMSDSKIRELRKEMYV